MKRSKLIVIMLAGALFLQIPTQAKASWFKTGNIVTCAAALGALIYYWYNYTPKTGKSSQTPITKSMPVADIEIPHTPTERAPEIRQPQDRPEPRIIKKYTHLTKRLVERAYKEKTITIYLVEGDICNLTVDAIVNPAQESLRAGRGLCGKIHQRSPELEEACLQFPFRVPGTTIRCQTGNAIITPSYDGGVNGIKAQRVIHAVGPNVKGKRKTALHAEQLKNTYQNVLWCTNQYHSLECTHGDDGQAPNKSIAFPAISTGIYGYPVEEATKIAIETIKSFDFNKIGIDTVYFVIYPGDEKIETYRKAYLENLDKHFKSAHE